MLVRLDASWPGVTSIRLDVAAGTRDGVKHGLQLVSGVFERQEAAGEDRFEGALGAGALGRSGRDRGGTWKTHPAAIGDRAFELILSIYQWLNGIDFTGSGGG